MRTLQEKYNAIQEGKFSKDQFLVEARMQQPQLVTRYNGYKDAVQILKNRGMIKESSAEESFADYSNDALTDMIINMSRYEGNEEEITRVKSELQRRKQAVKENYSRVLELPDGDYFAIDGDWEDEYQGKNGMFFTIDGYDIYDNDGESIQSSPREFLSQFKPEEIIKVETVNEANLGHNEISSIHQEGGSWIVTYRKDGTKEKVFKTEKEARAFEKTLNEASYKVSKNSKQAQHLKKGDIITSGDEIISVSAGAKTPAGKVEVTMKTKNGSTKTSIWGKTTMIGVKPVNEAKLTKKSLTDYRYKPTNDMDKYPYEQILRGLRVELEVLQIHGTPTAEEYKKALAKVLKNLEKDSIYYTNQLAGNNKKVDLHDKMVDATAKNTVDTFNGMKKVKDLKESHTGNPNDKYVVRPCKNKKEPWAVWEGEERVKGFATKEQAKEYADKQNKKQGLTESVLKEGIKNLIKKALMENEEDIYEMQGPKSDDEYKSELADYLEDNQIYGYTNRIHNIMTGPDEDEAYKELVEYLDSEGIYGYNRAIERIYSDYPYDQHWMNQPDEDDYYAPTEHEEEDEDDIPHPFGYEDEEDTMFESVLLKDLLD